MQQLRFLALRAPVNGGGFNRFWRPQLHLRAAQPLFGRLPVQPRQLVTVTVRRKRLST